MTDHVTHVMFVEDELASLISILKAANAFSSTPGMDITVSNLLSRIENFTAPSAKDPAFRAAAQNLPFVRDGECEIDDCAITSISDEGAYVMAWVWVSNKDLEDARTLCRANACYQHRQYQRNDFGLDRR